MSLLLNDRVSTDMQLNRPHDPTFPSEGGGGSTTKRTDGTVRVIVDPPDTNTGTYKPPVPPITNRAGGPEPTVDTVSKRPPGDGIGVARAGFDIGAITTLVKNNPKISIGVAGIIIATTIYNYSKKRKKK